MKRRSFVKTTVVSTVSAAGMMGTLSASGETSKKDREFYELRTYSFKDQKQQQLVADYFKNAAIPAFNKAGIKNIGIFKEVKPADIARLYVLIPYRSLDDMTTVQSKLSNDETYRRMADAYINAPAAEPAYDRIESSLLQAFTHMPNLQVPAGKKQIFELRRYEHATEGAGKKKLEMFNDAGEVDIFKRLGFDPVFFGETLIGQARPNLTYMLAFENMDAHDSHWKAFGSDPEWKKISNIPEYADAKLVSHITSTLLVPVDGSQI